MNVYQFQELRAYIFMHSSGQQGSGPEGADVSDSGSPAPPPFEKVRDLDLWPEEKETSEERSGEMGNRHKELDGSRIKITVCTLANIEKYPNLVQKKHLGKNFSSKISVEILLSNISDKNMK